MTDVLAYLTIILAIIGAASVVGVIIWTYIRVVCYMTTPKKIYMIYREEGHSELREEQHRRPGAD